MAALDFPASPTIDQKYPIPAVPGVPVYTWDGEKWTTKGGAIGSTGGADDPPPMDGVGTAGVSTQWAREDHIHPTDTSRASITYVDNETTAAETFSSAATYGGIQINGGMEVSQERGGNVLSLATGGDGYVIDNWKVTTTGQPVNAGLAVFTPPGFVQALNVLPTTANIAPAAGHFCSIYQLIEGYRISRLAWGTASAQPITLAFWIYAFRPGLYSGAITNGAFNRSYPFTFTINAASTWEYKIITIPGDTTGTWSVINTIGLTVRISMMVGTSLAATAGAWTAGGYLGATGSVNGVASTSDSMFITGVTVLPGTQAPTAAQSPNLMRPYGEELAICQRYFEMGEGPHMFLEAAGGSTNAYDEVRFAVTKRAVPAMGWPAWRYYHTTGAQDYFTPELIDASINKFVFGVGAGATNWAGWAGQGAWAADARL